VKVLAAPLGGVFACMSVEDTEESLTMHITEIVDESMCILHGPSPSLVRVFGYAYAEGGL